jgi:hypothetical protein
MLALYWLLLAIFAGWQFCHVFFGPASDLIGRMGSGQTGAGFVAAPWTTLLFRLAMAASIGVPAIAWLVYLVAALTDPVLPDNIHPLLVVNVSWMAAATIWAAWVLVRKRSRLFNSWPTLARSLHRPDSVWLFCCLAIWLLFAGWLMTSTFRQIGSQLHAGYSVFSDFAPHTALISSFSQGRNWPTVYPHFPGDGIAYHFMFFFLCGNLHYLGLPLAWAINIPSILALLTFTSLLGFLAVRLTGRPATFLLAPLMLFLRSSLAFFTQLADEMQRNAHRAGTLRIALGELWNRAAFIGSTPRDEWGLWGVNVYANQRHLLSGLSLLLVVLLLVLPDLQAGLFGPGRSGWKIAGPSDWRRFIGICLIVAMLPYWHGSALVALLLVLVPVALFAANRLGFGLTAAVAVASALLQSWFFSGQATRVVQPALFWGFIAPDTSLGRVLLYLLTVTGLALPLALVAFWMPGWRRKVLMAGFLLPLVFAFTVSLTPDVTVNHKYIMISLALLNIYLADLLVRLWTWAGHQKKPLASPVLMRRALAVLLGFCLMVTGVLECRLVRNINQNSVSLDTKSQLVQWVQANSRPDDIFVTAPYHYNAFFLSGRSVWFGHSYYAWSAGHDTEGRFMRYKQLLDACGQDLEAVRDLVQREKLDYLLIDNALRQAEDISVDEAFFNDNFQLVAWFPDLGDIMIYDLNSHP